MVSQWINRLQRMDGKYLLAIRWLLVVPAALVGYAGGLLLALIVYDQAGGLCPTPDHWRNGCGNDSLDMLLQALMLLGAAFTAFLVVLLPGLIAPAYKAWTGLSSLSIGSLYVLYMALQNLPDLVGAYVALAAIFGGIVGWLLLRRWFGDRP